MCNETLISYTPSQNVFSLQKNSQRRKENKRIMIKKKKNKKAYFLSQTRQKSEHKKRET